MRGVVTARRPLRVVVTDGRGCALRADRLRRWLAGVAPPSARGEVAIALVGDRKMRELNHRYRGIDRPTDVLAFPAGPAMAPDAGLEPGPDMAPGAASGNGSDAARGPRDVAPAAAPRVAAGGVVRHLGDIVIATGVARRQARAAGHRLGAELRCLALHGLLHLLGYDHERDTGEMARLEQRLRRQGGLA